jgi:TonB-dependent receptor
LPILTPYIGTDRVTAGYALADFELLPSLRIVGGARVEKWYAQLVEGAGAGLGAERIMTDVLWSTNLTFAMSPTTNLRAAAYRTVARPDLRELSTGGYPAVVGGPPVIGNPDLKAAAILNGDLRFEVYPAAEELFAVGVFAKRFTDPIVTTYRDAGGVVIKPDNGTKATSLGAELEFRKRLGFLAGALQPLLLNGNVTVIRSRVRMPALLGVYADDLEFQGQSPYLVNLGLTYTPGKPDLSVSVLFNRFGERIVRYPAASGAGLPAGANIVERPRSALDAKVKFGFWNKMAVSLSGKNLLNARRELTFDRVLNEERSVRILGRSLSGMTFSMGLSYAY